MIRKLINYLVKRNNEKISQTWDDYNFLEELCIEGRTLNLDKYHRLMKMVKRKYR